MRIIDADSLINKIEQSYLTKGLWISYPDNDYMGGGCVVCSVCDQHYSWGAYHEPEAFKFCPNCGAKMEGNE